MRVALGPLILTGHLLSVMSLLGLIYVFPGYSIDSAFSEALRKQPSPQASFWFHWYMTFFRLLLHDSADVSYTPQALRETLESRLTHQPKRERLNFQPLPTEATSLTISCWLRYL